MGNLNEIAHRHGRDRWKDVLFIGVALLMTAVAIGTVTSNGTKGTAFGTPHETVEVVYSGVEIVNGQ